MRSSFKPGKFLKDDDYDEGDKFWIRVIDSRVVDIQSGEPPLISKAPHNILKSAKIWEIGADPKDGVKNIGPINRRNAINRSEIITRWTCIDEKVYLYLRAIYSDENYNKSLKMGLYSPTHRWQNLIQDFENNMPLTELEKYCEY